MESGEAKIRSSDSVPSTICQNTGKHPTINCIHLLVNEYSDYPENQQTVSEFHHWLVRMAYSWFWEHSHYTQYGPEKKHDTSVQNDHLSKMKNGGHGVDYVYPSQSFKNHEKILKRISRPVDKVDVIMRKIAHHFTGADLNKGQSFSLTSPVPLLCFLMSCFSSATT